MTDRVPGAHRIEAARSGRASCTTCNKLVEHGDPRVAGAAPAVLADQLQARGDTRGELIAMQLAMASGRTSELAHRRAELMHALAPPLDPGDRLVWGTGFVRRLELADKTGARLADTIALWQHPSLRVLSELAISFAGSQAPTFVPRLV